MEKTDTRALDNRPILAVDIGGSKLAMAAFENQRPVKQHRQPTQLHGGQQWMLDQVLSLARRWAEEMAFSACGVGFGGPVDFANQQVRRSHPVAGWGDFPLAGFLSQALNLPTVMDNDANLGALGEAIFGAGRGYDPLLYLTLSTGIGGGLVMGGQVYRGADSLAGEIGHLTVRPEGERCLCGAIGCLERYCSGLWLQRDHGQPAQVLFQDSDFVARYVVDLASGLRSCLLLLNPSRVVIGGGISRASDRLFVPLRAELHRQLASSSLQPRIDLVPAALGDHSVLYGALALATAHSLPHNSARKASLSTS